MRKIVAKKLRKLAKEEDKNYRRLKKEWNATPRNKRGKVS